MRGADDEGMKVKGKQRRHECSDVNLFELNFGGKLCVCRGAGRGGRYEREVTFRERKGE